MKVVLALVIVTAIVAVAGVVTFAFGERAAKVSTEEALVKAVQNKLAAQHEMTKAEEERESALLAAINANQAKAAAEVMAAEAEKAKSAAEARASEAEDAKAAAENVAAQAEDSRAIAEEKELQAEREKDDALLAVALAQESQSAAESLAEEERQAKAVALQAAANFEQRAIKEKAVNEQLEKDVGIQKERAGAEAKARVLELARTQPLIQAIVTGELKFYFEPLPRYASEGASAAIEGVAELLFPQLVLFHRETGLRPSGG